MHNADAPAVIISKISDAAFLAAAYRAWDKDEAVEIARANPRFHRTSLRRVTSPILCDVTRHY